MKKILIVARDYPPEGVGGIATYVYNTTQNLGRLKNYRITVLAETAGLGQTKTVDGITIVTVHCLGKWQWYWQVTKWLVRNYREFNIIEDELYGANIFWAKIILGKKLKYHVNAHGSHRKTYLFENKRRLVDKLTLLVIDQMEKYVFTHSLYNMCPSLSYAEILSFQWIYPLENIYVVYNMLSKQLVDYSKNQNFNHGHNKLRLNNNNISRYFLYFGRLQRLKGVYYLMDMLPFLLPLFPGHYFIFVGRDDSDFSQEFTKVYKSSGLNNLLDKVIFLGNVKDKQKLYSLITNADEIFLPSIYESFSYAMFEAVVLNKKVCCTFAGGVKEILLNSRYQNYFPLTTNDNNLKLTAKYIKKWSQRPANPKTFDVDRYQHDCLNRYTGLLDMFYDI